MPEALELRFTEKSLKGGAGVNMGVVMLEGIISPPALT